MVLPFQVRGLRKDRGLSQGELAALVGMAQPRISEIEKPGERSLNIDTLLRIASGLDVALQIRFVPFGELVSWSENFDPDNFQIPSFDDELAEMEKAKSAAARGYTLQAMAGTMPSSPFTPESSSLLSLSRLQAYGQGIADYTGTGGQLTGLREFGSTSVLSGSIDPSSAGQEMPSSGPRLLEGKKSKRSKARSAERLRQPSRCHHKPRLMEKKAA